jgi:hypothetical protein
MVGRSYWKPEEKPEEKATGIEDFFSLLSKTQFAPSETNTTESHWEVKTRGVSPLIVSVPSGWMVTSPVPVRTTL